MIKNGATRQDVFDYVRNQYGTQDVPRKKLGLKGENTVDVFDIKCDPFASEILLQQSGFVPCYHLNKTHWIGVLLDGTVEKELLFQLIDELRSCG